MRKYTVSSGIVGLSPGTALTALQIKAPVDNHTKLTGIEVSFDGVTASDKPVRCQLFRQSDDGFGSSVVTPTAHVDDDPAAGTTALVAGASVTSDADPLAEFYVTPNGGTYVRDLSDDDFFDILQTERVGLLLTAPTNAVNTIVNFIFGE